MVFALIIHCVPTADGRLYNAGVDEQQVMEVTGHRSLDGVRTYKHTSMQQQEVLSDILNCAPRKILIESATVNMDLAKVSDPPLPVVTVTTSSTSQITSDCVNSMNALQSTLQPTPLHLLSTFSLVL